MSASAGASDEVFGLTTTTHGHYSQRTMDMQLLRSHLIQLKRDAVLTDVVISCHGKSFPVHKCVLSASSLFFKLLFTGHHSDITLKTFDMSIQCNSAEVLDGVLEFTYTGSIDLSLQNIVSVADVAHFLCMDDLICLCTTYFHEILDQDTCLRLYLALYKAETLRQVQDSPDRSMGISQVAWDMLECCFYDHVILQDEILKVSAEDMLHLLSRGIAKHFSTERVLHFVHRWLAYQTSADRLEIAEMFMNLTHERQQLESGKVETVDKTKVEELFRKLEELLKKEGTQTDALANAKASILYWLSDLREVMFSKTGEAQRSDEQRQGSKAASDVSESLDVDNANQDKGVVKTDVSEGIVELDGPGALKQEGMAEAHKGSGGLSVMAARKDFCAIGMNETSGEIGVQNQRTSQSDGSASSDVLGNIQSLASGRPNRQCSTAVATDDKKDDCIDVDADDVLDDAAMEEEEMMLLEQPDIGDEMHEVGNGAISIKTSNNDSHKTSNGTKAENMERIVKERIQNCLLSQNLIDIPESDNGCPETNNSSNNIKRKGTARKGGNPSGKKLRIEDNGMQHPERRLTKLKLKLRSGKGYQIADDEVKAETLDKVVVEALHSGIDTSETLFAEKENDESATDESDEESDTDDDEDDVEDDDEDGEAEIETDQDWTPVNEYGKTSKQSRSMNTDMSSNGKAKHYKDYILKGDKYECQICLKVLKSSKTVKNHMNSHAGIKPYRCVVCGMLFGRSHHLIRHTTKKHSEAGEYACDECDEKFTQASDLNSHARIHADKPQTECEEAAFQQIEINNDGTKTYTCKVCSKIFTRAYHLKTHIRRHIGLTPYKCEICSAEFIRKSELNQHHNWVHKGKRPRYKCPVCKTPFNNKDNYEKHVSTCKRKFQCDICSVFFYRQYHLDRHMAVHSDEKPYECTECNKKFKQEDKMKEHMRRHKEGPTHRPQVCDVCGAVLKDIKYLKRHMDSHLGVRYECHICKKSYTQQAGLQVHMRIHTGAKPYQCEICSMLFAVKSNLMRHQRRHRGDKKHKCDRCGKGFIMRGDLRRHYTMHTGEKNYPCRFCGKKFSTKSKLPQHERIHTGEKPYNCSVCGKGFIQSCDRKRHEATHGFTPPAGPRRLSLYEMANGVKEEDDRVILDTIIKNSKAGMMTLPTLTEVEDGGNVQGLKLVEKPETAKVGKPNVKQTGSAITLSNSSNVAVDKRLQIDEEHRQLLSQPGSGLTMQRLHNDSGLLYPMAESRKLFSGNKFDASGSHQ